MAKTTTVRKTKVGTDRASVLKNARRLILQNRRQLAKTMVDLFQNVDDVLAHPSISDEQADYFLRGCGMIDSEIQACRAFAPRLKNHKNLLIEKRVAFETVNALLRLEDQVLREAIERLNVGAKLGPGEVQAIASEFERFKTTEEQLTLKAFDEHLEREAHRIAREQAVRFRAGISSYLESIRQYKLLLGQLPGTEEELWELEVSGDFDFKNLDQRHHDLKNRAGALLKRFDHLFPNSYRPQEDWADLAIDDPLAEKLAVARYVLSSLSHGIWSVLNPENGPNYTWDGYSALEHLISEPSPKLIDDRRSARTTRKLNVVGLCSASGGGTLGLESAGYHIRALYEDSEIARRSITTNRPTWKVSSVGVKDFRLSTDIRETLYMNKHDSFAPLHLLAGTLPGRPWHRKQRGERDERQIFAELQALLRDLQPETFVFENTKEFMDERHSTYRSDLTWALNNLGYSVGFVEVDAAQYGLPQARERVAITGIKKTLGREISPPVLIIDRKTTLWDHIADLVGFSAGWIERWRKSYGKNLAPDVATLLEINDSVKKHWTDAGFSLRLVGAEFDEVDETKDDLLPIPVSILKRLQGLPDNWQLNGTIDEQIAQICNTTPPIIYKALALAAHTAITGELIDLDKALSTGFEHTAKPIRHRFGPRPLSEHDDPKRRQAYLWRRQIEEQQMFDDEPTHLPALSAVPRPTLAPWNPAMETIRLRLEREAQEREEADSAAN